MSAAAMSPRMESNARLPWSRIAMFGLGDWGPSTTSTAVLFFLPFFLTDVARLPPRAVAVVLLIGGIWDALVVPWAGAFTDRVRTRWGRRRPFLLLGALPFALTFSALWWIPPVGTTLRTLWFVCAYLAFDTAFALVQVPYTALTPEMSTRSDDRTLLNAARAGVSMLGGLCAAALIPWAVRQMPTLSTGYRITMMIVGLVGALPFVLLGARVRERNPAENSRAVGIVTDIRSLVRSPAVQRVAWIYFLAWVAVAVVAAMFEYYIVHAMGLAEHLERVLGLVQLAALASVPLVAWSSERWGRGRTLAIGATLWTTVLCALALIPRGSVGIGYALAALVGPGIAAAHVVPWTLVTDLVDADEKSSGRRREGAVYGLLGLLQKGGGALALAACQATLSLAGYAAHGAQSIAVQWTIRGLFALVPAVLLTSLAWRASRLTHTAGRT